MINPLSVELPIQVSWSFPPPDRDSAGNVLFVYAFCLMLNLEQVRSSNVSIVETDFMSHHNSSCVRVGNNGNRRTTELGFESMRVSDVEERREGWPEKKDEGVWKHGGRRRGVSMCQSLSAIVVESDASLARFCFTTGKEPPVPFLGETDVMLPWTPT